ncbi:STAS domain-containing protein [Plantactinospora sp. WMMB782]|uniref:STAS domain-containing protein n=1 Tax=Plantactinospora sp. WMMB782 TaxID=3404121 RepID=UPI003B964A50
MSIEQRPVSSASDPGYAPPGATGAPSSSERDGKPGPLGRGDESSSPGPGGRPGWSGPAGNGTAAAGTDTVPAGAAADSGPDGVPALRIAVAPDRNGVLRMRLVGDLDMDTAELLRRTVDRTLGHPFGTLVVDLSQLDFCDSSGIRTLLFGVADAERLGRRLVVVNPRPFVRRVLELTGVTALLGLAADTH